MSSGGSDHSVLNQVAEGWNSLAQSVTTYNPRTGKWGGAGDYSQSAFGKVFKALGSTGNGLNDAVSTASNAIGYNPKTGQWGGSGSDVSWLNEGFGQINGSNAARHAQGVAGDAVLAAQAQENLLLQQTQEQKRQADVQASSSAGAIRATAAAQSARVFAGSTTTPMAFGNKLGASGQDYLGV